MKTLYKILWVLLLLPLGLYAGNFPTGNYTKEKKINKTFDVQKEASLNIDNRYGNVDVITWNKNEIQIEITITTSGNKESHVQKQLDNITVDFVNSSSSVSAKTIINSISQGWTFWGRSSNVNFQINYLVKMPLNNHLTIKNNYGVVSLDKLKGNATIRCDYGKLILGELQGKQNILYFNYTNNSTINLANNVNIQANYSEFILENSNDVVYVGNYTNSNFENVKSLHFKSNYGRIHIGSVEQLVGEGQYITKRIGLVTKTINIQSKYGSLNVEELGKTFQQGIINARYTNIKVGYHPDASFQFLGKVSYASVRGIENIHLKSRVELNSKKEYEGYYNSEKSKNSLVINSDYGGVQLNKL